MRVHHALSEGKALIQAANDTSCNVLCIINSRVMFSLELKFAELKHMRHSSNQRFPDISLKLDNVLRSGLIIEVNREHLLDVYPSLHVVRDVELFMKGFPSDLVPVEVTTG